MNHYPILFISLGPGDPELITLKGWKALQAADIVFCPETEGRNGERTSRAANIVRRLGVGDDHIRRFLLPMSKRREAALQAYDGVYAEARALQDEGLHVCIVAEGDAGFYSSVHYVFERLRADGRVPGTATAQELERLVDDGGTVVIMKLSQCADEVHRCMALHPEYTYHYFENVGTATEFYTCDAAVVAARRFPYFSLMIVQG